MSHTKPAIVIITLAIIALSFIVNQSIRPLFNLVVAKVKHHNMIEARRREFYSGLSAIMNSERTPGHKG